MRTLGLALAIVAAASGCARPGVARLGSVLTLHYTLYVDDAVYDSTANGEPAKVALGDGALPPGVERALLGARAGQEVWVTLAPEQAYGRRDPAAFETVPRARFDAIGLTAKAGERVMGLRQGKPAEATVESVSGEGVRLDFNHRLAGKTVSFRLSVVSVAP